MKPFVIAHRGDSAHRPENTLAAFASALEVGADFVEMDVQLTRDAHVVVLHDATVDRTTSGRGDVRQMTLAELKSFSAGHAERFGTAFQGQRVPTLAETLALLRDRARAMIEIKSDSVTDHDDDGGIEALTVQDVRRAGVAQEVVLISFDRRALLRCRSLAPDIARGHLFYAEGRRDDPALIEEMIAGARAVGSELILPHKSMLSEKLRDQAKAAGIHVATWVVDEVAELKALLPLELYGVGSNRPAEMLDALSDEL